MFDGTIRDWQVVIPDFGTVEGPFQIASFEITGRHDGEVAFELSLELRRRADLPTANCLLLIAQELEEPTWPSY